MPFRLITPRNCCPNGSPLGKKNGKLLQRDVPIFALLRDFITPVTGILPGDWWINYSGKNTVKAIVYIKINNEFKTLPSNEYLEAINRMLDNRGYDNERVIMVRAVIKDKIKTLGKWDKTYGYIKISKDI